MEIDFTLWRKSQWNVWAGECKEKRINLPREHKRSGIWSNSVQYPKLKRQKWSMSTAEKSKCSFPNSYNRYLSFPLPLSPKVNSLNWRQSRLVNTRNGKGQAWGTERKQKNLVKVHKLNKGTHIYLPAWFPDASSQRNHSSPHHPQLETRRCLFGWNYQPQRLWEHPPHHRTVSSASDFPVLNLNNCHADCAGHRAH